MRAATLSAPLPIYPRTVIALGKVGMALIGALCASILIGLLLIGKRHSIAVLDSMVLLACIIQLLAVALQAQALGRSVSVLQAQRAPAALWQAWLRQWLWSVTRYWALLSLSVALLMLTPASPLHWLTAPAVLSLQLSFCTTAVLARAGLLPRWMGLVLEIILVALLVLLTATHHLLYDLHRFAALPVWLLAACALIWPVKACWIMHSQSDALGMVVDSQTNTLRKVRDAIALWAGRFQPLRDRTEISPPLNRRTLLVLAIMQNVIFFAQLVPVQWGEQVTGVRLSRLAMICLIFVNALLVRDVHWRTLLLPGGTQLRRLGTRIMLSTLTFQAPLLLAFVVGSLLLSPPQVWGWHAVGTFMVPMLELACCIALMTLLRAAPPRLQFGASMLLVLPMIYVYAAQWFKPDWPQPAWQIGPFYVLVLMASTATLLAIANRCWTPRRLLAALR